MKLCQGKRFRVITTTSIGNPNNERESIHMLVECSRCGAASRVVVNFRNSRWTSLELVGGHK